MPQQTPGIFARFSRCSSTALGHPWAFALAIGGVVVWALFGPACHYSDTWQLTLNTITHVVTFLTVFIIQNTQNHHAAALQLKLDELLRAQRGAHNALLNIEDASEEELDALQDRYRRLRERIEAKLNDGIPDTDAPELEEIAEGAQKIERAAESHREPRPAKRPPGKGAHGRR
jgi:low affinity Fe/Cu permease